MSKPQDTYVLEKTIEYPNCIIRVHRPVLTEEERTRRMQKIHDAAADLLKDVYAKRERKVANG